MSKLVNRLKIALWHPNEAITYSIVYLTRIKRMAKLLGTDSHVVNEYLKELFSKDYIFNDVQEAATKYQTGDVFGTFRILYGPLLYVVCRTLKPKYVVETGVANGLSSYFLLEALEENNSGTLYSVDLPNTSYKISSGKEDNPILPLGKKTGWIVPDRLRHRWSLNFGRSSEILLPLFQNLGQIDVFLHDSEHTYQNMIWEFETAWGFLRDGGVLLSDDITWNNAFTDFHKKVKGETVFFNSYGGIKKYIEMNIDEIYL